MRVIAVAAIAVLFSTAAFAGWQERATPFDKGRLARLDSSREKGLAALAHGPVSGDANVIRGVTEARTGGAAGNIAGSWRCRTMKLGGIVSVQYGWFNCRIENRGGTLTFRKLNGSQRLTGTLYPEGAGYVLLGAWTVNDDPPQPYSGNAPGAGAQSTPGDAVGYLSAIGANHLKIEFPEPVQESDFDVMELKR